MILANGCNITKSEKCKGVWILSVPTVYIILYYIYIYIYIYIPRQYHIFGQDKNGNTMFFLDMYQSSTIAPLKYHEKKHESSLQYHHNYHGNTTVLILEGNEFGFHDSLFVFTLPFKGLGSLRFFYVSEKSFMLTKNAFIWSKIQ